MNRRVSRCERALFGDEDSSEGLSARTKMLESTVSSIDATLKKLNWLLIAGVIVGVLNLVLRNPTSPGSNSQSVNVGHADDASAQLASARDYLTTAEVADKEKVSERTVTQWITEGRLDPPPVKAGKSWTIAKNVRILPQDTAECGETPQP